MSMYLRFTSGHVFIRHSGGKLRLELVEIPSLRRLCVVGWTLRWSRVRRTHAKILSIFEHESQDNGLPLVFDKIGGSCQYQGRKMISLHIQYYHNDKVQTASCVLFVGVTGSRALSKVSQR